MDYVVGLAKSTRFLALAYRLSKQAAANHGQSQDKQRLFGWLDYPAGTSDRERWVIAKAAHSNKSARREKPSSQASLHRLKSSTASKTPSLEPW